MALGAAGGSEPGEAVPEGNRSPAKVLPGSLPTRPPRENPWRICSGFVSLSNHFSHFRQKKRWQLNSSRFVSFLTNRGSLIFKRGPLPAAGGGEPGEAVAEGNGSPAKVLPTRPPRENPWRICSGFVSLIISLTSGKKEVAIKLESRRTGRVLGSPPSEKVQKSACEGDHQPPPTTTSTSTTTTT